MACAGSVTGSVALCTLLGVVGTVGIAAVAFWIGCGGRLVEKVSADSGAGDGEAVDKPGNLGALVIVMEFVDSGWWCVVVNGCWNKAFCGEIVLGDVGGSTVMAVAVG